MLSLQDQAVLYRRMEALARSGFTPSQSLAAIAESQRHRKQEKLNRAARLLRDGSDVQNALQSCGTHPDLHVALMAAGDATGQLDCMYNRLAEAAEQKIALRNLLKRELLPPKITMVVALPFAWGFLTYGGPSTLATIIFGSLVLAFLAILVAEFALTGISSFVPVELERLFLRVPILGGISETAAQAKFARSFASLFGVGIGVASALKIAAESSGSGVLTERVITALPSIERGRSISAALEATQAISSDMLNTLSTGETAGDIDRLMEFVARQYEDETLTKLHKLTVALGIMATLVVGGIVGMILISFWVGLPKGG